MVLFHKRGLLIKPGKECERCKNSFIKLRFAKDFSLIFIGSALTREEIAVSAVLICTPRTAEAILVGLGV